MKQKGVVYIIYADGTVSYTAPLTEGRLTKKMTNIIGTEWIRPLILNNLKTKTAFVMFVDENARMKNNEKVNRWASAVAGQELLGDVAIVKSCDSTILPLDEDDAAEIDSVLDEIKEREGAGNEPRELIYYWYHHGIVPAETRQLINEIVEDHDYRVFKILQQGLNAIAAQNDCSYCLPNTAWDNEFERNVELTEANFNLIVRSEYECG